MHDFHICLFCPLLCEAVGDEQLLSHSFICSDVLQDCFVFFALPKRREGGKEEEAEELKEKEEEKDGR